MEFGGNIRAAVIAKTLRVPAAEGTPGDGRAAARQLDVALLSVGFKCTRELLGHLSSLHPTVVHEAGAVVLQATRELVGDHVQHNPYFIDFPENVPDTLEFWATCIAQALLDPRSAGNVAGQVARGEINLLDLPRYGRLQHTYEELLAAHEQLIPAAGDRVTVLELGGSLAAESHALYLSLAASRMPLAEHDLALLETLAGLHVGDAQPEAVPIRENRAVINRVRLAHELPLVVDTPVDVLRLACALSDGDVTLSTPTRLRSLRRAERRGLLAALDAVVRENPAKLADVTRHAEPFKRLGERLHPHEHPRWPSAQDVFAVARGERATRSLAARAELAFAAGKPDEAAALLQNAPGMLMRSVDRLARAGAERDALIDAVRRAAPDVSTRVLLSLREHLINRDGSAALRAFVNRRGGSWVRPEHRDPLPPATVAELRALLDAVIAGRLPRTRRLVVEPAARMLAVPLSEKSRPQGLGILPRGSVHALTPHVRFFIHWKQRARRTDYDLSVLLLDDEFRSVGQVSWTNLRHGGIVHSGDVTEAPDGATEFIDMDLADVSARYVVPQVNVYAGESFDAADEAFFGFMQRPREQRGRPFEPRTVRAKSDLFGTSHVALPVLFARGNNGTWTATWLHLGLSGWPEFNRVEVNRRSTSLVVRAIAQRRYLRLGYVEELLRAGGAEVHDWPVTLDPREAVTYIGMDRPQGLPPGSAIFTPANLAALLNSA